jgi:stage V sporulation protein B
MPGAHKVFKVTLKLMMVFGLIFALFVRDGRRHGGLWLYPGQRAYLALVVLTPAVFFSSILASFRGYFKGISS